MPEPTIASIRQWLSTHDVLWENLIFIALVALGVAVINIGLGLLRRSLLAHERSIRSIWRVPVLEALHVPLRWAIRIIGLTMIVGFLTRGEYELPLVERFFPPTRDFALIVLMVWFAMGAIYRTERRIEATGLPDGQTVDQTAADAVGKLARIAVVFIAIIMTMPVLGFSISGILAFGGIGGIAIGFAAQGLVANLLGGLTIYASRPFVVGETIIMPEHGIEGTVEEIGWRATRVMGFNRRPAYVPNALFNTAIVTNFSRMGARRIREHVRLRYEDLPRVPAIVTEVREMLETHPALLRDTCVFRLDSCGDSSIDLLLYVFLRNEGYDEEMRVKEELLLKIHDIAKRHGARFALPVREIHTIEATAPTGG